MGGDGSLWMMLTIQFISDQVFQDGWRLKLETFIKSGEIRCVSRKSIRSKCEMG